MTDSLSTAASSFPTDFGWGAATSAFQIEGATTTDGRGESIWDRRCAVPGAIADGTDGEGPAQHYHRFPEDIAVLNQLNLSAYRFSIAWPRVVPDGLGAVNPLGLDFYDRLVDALLAAGITPFPTLYHWDLPQGLQDIGGWTNRDTANHFADYAHVVAERLADRVSSWTTLNEPFVSADHGHVTGEHAPGHTSQAEGFAVAHHLMLAHGLATRRLREVPGVESVGCVLNFTPVSPRSESPEDLAHAREVNDWENRWYIEVLSGNPYPAETVESLGWDQAEVHDGDLETIAQPLDFLGVNFYSRQIVSADSDWKHVPELRTDMGWEIHPHSLGELLRWIHREYDFPELMITENGAAMPDQSRINGQVYDPDRIDYLRAHLLEVAGAVHAGVPVSRYFVWSLLDNFEWAHGYAKTFGIVEVRDDGTRVPKASADWFAEVARTGQVPPANTPGEQS